MDITQRYAFSSLIYIRTNNVLPYRTHEQKTNCFETIQNVQTIYQNNGLTHITSFKYIQNTSMILQ